jgi:hypothetical protein
MKRFAVLLFPAIFLMNFASVAQSSMIAVPVVNQLSKEVNDSIRTLLKRSWAPSLKDTVIIQYDRPMPPGVVRENDDIIQQKVTAELRLLHASMVARKNITILEFAADDAGNNDLGQFNNLIIIDKDRALYNLLFKDHEAGSVMLLASGQCTWFPGKEKWMALQ